MSVQPTTPTSTELCRQDGLLANPSPEASAPMASAPICYNEDGSVAWDEMWESFCTLASEGGPPHRGTMLKAPAPEDPFSPEYQGVGSEIIRGIRQVSGLEAHHAKPGWMAVQCANAAHARWMSEQIMLENVESYAQGSFFFVPIASTFTLSGEIKNVITVVAKSSHYWRDHMQSEVKTLMAWEARIKALLSGWSKPKK